MSCDLTKRIEFLEKKIALILKNGTGARKKLIDEADDGKEDELPTEDQIQKKLAKMWQSKQEDKEFFETHYRAFKKEVK